MGSGEDAPQTLCRVGRRQRQGVIRDSPCIESCVGGAECRGAGREASLQHSADTLARGTELVSAGMFIVTPHPGITPMNL